MVTPPGGENVLVTAWAWTCSRGYPWFCHAHAMGMPARGYVVITAVVVMMAWLRDRADRPSYRCPMCGTETGEHGANCSWRD